VFNHWIKVAATIAKESQEISNISCPHCKDKNLDYLYIGDEKTHIGYVQIWCNTCLTGINISRVKIPKEAKTISFDSGVDLEELIPKYNQVSPGE